MTKKKELSVYRVETLELRSDKGHESTLRKWQEELEWIKCTAATGRKLDRAKTLLVLLNPKSGIGQASKIFTEQVEPLLQGCGLEYTVCVTERPGHARDIAAEKAFADRHSAVLIVAGDGLVHEVVAGMMSASSPAPVPLAVVAGGSGNGLVASLVDLWGHAFINYGVMSSAVKLCRGDIRSLDLIQITTQSGRTIHIVNSFGIGFIADMDIDSDNLRWIGEIRFFLYGTIGLITLPAYRVMTQQQSHYFYSMSRPQIFFPGQAFILARLKCLFVVGRRRRRLHSGARDQHVAHHVCSSLVAGCATR